MKIDGRRLRGALLAAARHPHVLLGLRLTAVALAVRSVSRWLEELEAWARWRRRAELCPLGDTELEDEYMMRLALASSARGTGAAMSVYDRLRNGVAIRQSRAHGEELVVIAVGCNGHLSKSEGAFEAMLEVMQEVQPASKADVRQQLNSLSRHAVANAIYNSQFSTATLEGATLYAVYAPSTHCVALLAAHGVQRVIYRHWVRGAEDGVRLAARCDVSVYPLLEWGPAPLRWVLDRLVLRRDAPVFSLNAADGEDAAISGPLEAAAAAGASRALAALPPSQRGGAVPPAKPPPPRPTRGVADRPGGGS